MKQNAFGFVLRAVRLGYHKMNCVGWVRIAGIGPPWHVRIVPEGHWDALKASGDCTHVVWWETRDPDNVLGFTIRTALNMEEPQSPVDLWLDDDGKPDKMRTP